MQEQLKQYFKKATTEAKFLFAQLKQKPLIAFGVIALFLAIYFLFAGNSDLPEKHPLMAQKVPFSKEHGEMSGVSDAIDPRAAWTAKLERELQESKIALESNFEKQNKETQDVMSRLQNEVETLREQMAQQKIDMARGQQSQQIIATEVNTNKPKLVKTLGVFSKRYNGKEKKQIDNYITSGAFARAVLLTGVVVGTGSNTVSNPEPIMLRLTDAGIFSKNMKTEQIKEAILIGDCSGDLSSERAKCRLQTLSLKNKDGDIIEKPVKGWVVGEDARFGIKGHVIDKSSDMMRFAMINGVLSGASKFFESQTISEVFPISPISGRQKALNATNMAAGGAASGAGNAFEKLADFVMERFNSMTPQIMVEAGREVDVVFQHGVDLKFVGGGSGAKAMVAQGKDGNFEQLVGQEGYQHEFKKAHSNQSMQTNNRDFNNFAKDLQRSVSGGQASEVHDGF